MGRDRCRRSASFFASDPMSRVMKASETAIPRCSPQAAALPQAQQSKIPGIVSRGAAGQQCSGAEGRANPLLKCHTRCAPRILIQHREGRLSHLSLARHNLRTQLFLHHCASYRRPLLMLLPLLLSLTYPSRCSRTARSSCFRIALRPRTPSSLETGRQAGRGRRVTWVPLPRHVCSRQVRLWRQPSIIYIHPLATHPPMARSSGRVFRRSAHRASQAASSPSASARDSSSIRSSCWPGGVEEGQRAAHSPGAGRALFHRLPYGPPYSVAQHWLLPPAPVGSPSSGGQQAKRQSPPKVIGGTKMAAAAAPFPWAAAPPGAELDSHSESGTSS